jgi:calcineurin-like phosphoesterase family protein
MRLLGRRGHRQPARRHSGTVFTAGDNAYSNGIASEFTSCYSPSWGRHKARTKPSAGNHDYTTAGATGYYGYFGAAAGDPAKGYYSYNLGNWHVIAINSNCSPIGGCGAGSAQEQWLRQDLAASTKLCTLAYWHHPLFTSGSNHTNATKMRPIFQALYDFSAEVVVSGHNHNYERFAPQNPTGGLDNARGIRELVAGTGGISHYSFGTIQPNSQVRNADTYGVLKLTLHASSYDWQFVPEAGKTFSDSGTTACH